MHNNHGSLKRWKLTLLADDASPTVVNGLSDDQMRRAVSAVMSGDGDSIERLTNEVVAARVDRAA